MHFIHAPAIWAAFPGLSAGLLLVEGVRPDAPPGDRLAPLYAQARARLGDGSESDLPSIQAWRRAFAQMGLKPTQYRSAAEALLRRLRRGEELPTLHPLVDLCNALSVAHALPVAAIDLDQVAGWVEVRYADGDEAHLAFSGEVERPEPGEVIFADAERHAHARRWTFRQSRRSTVGPATRRALIVSEGLHAGAAADVGALLGALERELPQIGCAPSRAALLRPDAPRWDAGW